VLFACSSRSGFSLAATSLRAACSGFFLEGVLSLHLQPELASPLKDHLGRHPSGPPSTVGFSDKLLAPIPANGAGAVVVGIKGERAQLGCPCTLKLWEATGPRTVTLGNVTLPESKAKGP